jgi:hypothetical protein
MNIYSFTSKGPRSRKIANWCFFGASAFSAHVLLFAGLDPIQCLFGSILGGSFLGYAAYSNIIKISARETITDKL